MTQALVLGTAGHIDHGKTTLIQALTGTNCDRLPEERRRGMTIDIGFASLDLPQFHLAVIDVPGHERFIRNMLAGAVGMDLALLVVAADDSVMPQTREHLAILQLLGIQHGVIVLTKCDRVEEDWLAMVEEDIRQLVAKTFLEAAPLVRTSVVKDGPPRGLTELRAVLGRVCERCKSDNTAHGEPFRLPVDRSFDVSGLGAVVTGTIWSGSVQRHDQLELLPARTKVMVRGLQTHGAPAERIRRGQRAAINVTGVSSGEVARGCELATPGFLAPSKLLTVEMQVLPDSPRPIKHRSRQRLHLGTQEITVTVALLAGESFAPGESGLAQLRAEPEAIATAGQPFVLRAESPARTIGGGRILQPIARPIGRRQHSQVDRLRALASPSETERIEAAIYFYGTTPWNELSLVRDSGASATKLDKRIGELCALGRLVKLGAKARESRLVHCEVLSELQGRVMRTLERLHRESPLRRTIESNQINAAARLRLNAQSLELLVQWLLDRGAVSGDLHHLALPGFAPRLSERQRQLRERLLGALRASWFKPLGLSELAAATDSESAALQAVLSLCVQEGSVRPLADHLFLHADADRAMRLKLTPSLATGEGLTVSEIRDLLETSRKFAVPICEYLDAVGFTRRRGDRRLLREAVG